MIRICVLLVATLLCCVSAALHSIVPPAKWKFELEDPKGENLSKWSFVEVVREVALKFAMRYLSHSKPGDPLENFYLIAAFGKVVRGGGYPRRYYLRIRTRGVVAVTTLDSDNNEVFGDRFVFRVYDCICTISAPSSEGFTMDATKLLSESEGELMPARQENLPQDAKNEHVEKFQMNMEKTEKDGEQVRTFTAKKSDL